MKVPQLRTLFERTGFSKTDPANNRGYGFLHDGAFDSIFNFLKVSQFQFPAGAPGDAQRRDLEAFLMCFPSDTHPAVGVQQTVTGTNKNDAAVVSLVNTMVSLADSGVVGLVAKGVVGGQQRGYTYVQNSGNFQSDRLSEVVGSTALRLSATNGGEITFTVVPFGTQTRIGIDRDEDGFNDRDELDAGTNPADPSSHPAAFLRGDMNIDGVVNSLDVPAFVAVLLSPMSATQSQRDHADMNADTLNDASDVQAFVNLMP